MSHIPFGYRIENGKAVIDKEAAEQIKTLFHSYLSGDSLATAAKKAGIKAFHAGIGRIHNALFEHPDFRVVHRCR
jgi:acetyl/propionyl-CoA carboxylase alpha subunit